MKYLLLLPLLLIGCDTNSEAKIQDTKVSIAVDGAWHAFGGEIIPDDSPVGKCDNCGGLGKVGDGREMVTCIVCGGDGIKDEVLTKLPCDCIICEDGCKCKNQDDCTVVYDNYCQAFKKSSVSRKRIFVYVGDDSEEAESLKEQYSDQHFCWANDKEIEFSKLETKSYGPPQITPQVPGATSRAACTSFQ